MAMLPKAEFTWTLNGAAHLPGRAGFGGGPEKIKTVEVMGRVKAVVSLPAS